MTDITSEALPSSAVDMQEGGYDPEMEKILQAMLDEDEDVTARGVIRRHSALNAASSITRNKNRMEMIERFKARQDEFRGWRKRVAKVSRDTAAMGLADKDIRIAELESQVEILIASHVAMLRAVGELGGFAKWAKFFESYKEVTEKLGKIGAMPTADVIGISAKK